jgi:hypothetical protein
VFDFFPFLGHVTDYSLRRFVRCGIHHAMSVLRTLIYCPYSPVFANPTLNFSPLSLAHIPSLHLTFSYLCDQSLWFYSHVHRRHIRLVTELQFAISLAVILNVGLAWFYYWLFPTSPSLQLWLALKRNYTSLHSFLVFAFGLRVVGFLKKLFENLLPLAWQKRLDVIHYLLFSMAILLFILAFELGASLK